MKLHIDNSLQGINMRKIREYFASRAPVKFNISSTQNRQRDNKFFKMIDTKNRCGCISFPARRKNKLSPAAYIVSQRPLPAKSSSFSHSFSKFKRMFLSLIIVFVFCNLSLLLSESQQRCKTATPFVFYFYF